MKLVRKQPHFLHPTPWELRRVWGALLGIAPPRKSLASPGHPLLDRQKPSLDPNVARGRCAQHPNTGCQAVAAVQTLKLGHRDKD